MPQGASRLPTLKGLEPQICFSRLDLPGIFPRSILERRSRALLIAGIRDGREPALALALVTVDSVEVMPTSLPHQAVCLPLLPGSPE